MKVNFKTIDHIDLNLFVFSGSSSDSKGGT
jgi:hypothetical protein